MSDQVPQVIRKMPAARGLAWVSGSWGLVKRQPFRLLLISLFFQFLMIFLQAAALGLVVILCLPVLSAGFLHAFYLVEQGKKPMLAVLFIPFSVKQTFGSLLLLGGFAMALTLVVTTLVMAGQMLGIDPDIIAEINPGDIEALLLIDPQILENIVLSVALGVAISGAITYFSIPLIWFRKQRMGSALRLGLKGLGRNWKPLLVIGLLLGILMVPIALLFGSIYLSVLSEGTASTFLDFLLRIIGSLFQLLLFGTQYLAFRDIFGLDETIVPANKKNDQLVA